MPTTIDEIEEMADLFEIMTAFGLSTKGLKGVDGMKAKLREYLKDLEGSSKRKVGETFQVLSEACKTDAYKRGTLFKLYEEAAEFFQQLDEDFIIQNLQESLGDFKITLEEYLNKLKPRDQYVVLVAGETSAGKSSIINLILGKDLLPYSILSTTSTICELKYGEKPAIRVHFKDGSGETREPIYQELGHSSVTYKEEIEEFVHLKDEREKGSPYKKIELFWPHPLFKEGVMIVDSPGVGESNVMNEFALSYLPHAFCFIYVINSSNAGGIQEDRLCVLLNQAINLKEKANMDVKLFTSCALFVCNKWDDIPAKDVEDVKKKQIETLTKKWGDIDQQSQIIYFSCHRAQLAQNYGVISEDFDQLLSGINNLVISFMQTSLQIYSRWLEEVLSRASTQVRTVLKSTDMSRQETEKRMKRVMDRMMELESSQDRIFGELSEYQSQVIKEVIANLVKYFQSEETSNEFCKWSKAQLPEARPTWEQTKSEVLKCISERAQQYVQEWEDDKHHFAKAQVALIKYFTEKYDIMEEEIRKVEEDVFGEVDHESPTHEPPKPSTSHKRRPKKSIDVTAPVWFRQGLASVVVGAPFVGALTQKFKQSFQYKKKLEKYNTDPFPYMKKKSSKCLKIIASEDRLLPFINGQLEDAVQFLIQMKAKIPRLREGDKKLYRKLLTESRSKLQIQGTYAPVSTRLDELKRDITVFNVKEIRKSDFSGGELQWMEEEKSVIGKGTFSTVYSGILSRKGEPEIKVALKVYSNPLKRNNVWHFIDEEIALRELRHPNIVKFFGTNLQKSSCGTKVMVILELCECSLKTRIMSQPENAPANSEDVKVRNNVLPWALQILDALRYVHDHGFVHRDLKLENLLLTVENKVKLTDVGVAKHEKDITGTMCGTLLYLAPEVMDGRIYDSKADMYSFGMILWEMWYAKTAFQNELASRSHFKLLNDIKGGLRPSHFGGTRQPWGMWQLLMQTCWDSEPQRRLSAQETRNELQKFQKLQKVKDMQSVSPSDKMLHSSSGHELPTAEPNPPPSKPQPVPKPRRLVSKPQVPPKPAPRPAPKPNAPKRASVSFSSKTEDANVHFQ